MDPNQIQEAARLIDDAMTRIETSASYLEIKQDPRIENLLFATTALAHAVSIILNGITKAELNKLK